MNLIFDFSENSDLRFWLASVFGGAARVIESILFILVCLLIMPALMLAVLIHKINVVLERLNGP